LLFAFVFVFYMYMYDPKSQAARYRKPRVNGDTPWEPRVTF